MEDYKQKYDKAFGRAKALYAKGAPDSLHLEEIFPELQDSDDDRIRKALITHIKYNVSVISGWRKEELIAWLEKQGKQIPIKWTEEDVLNINQAIYVCHQYEYFGVETWLKSLRERIIDVI